jgi:hypothetical protein
MSRDVLHEAQDGYRRSWGQPKSVTLDRTAELKT